MTFKKICERCGKRYQPTGKFCHFCENCKLEKGGRPKQPRPILNKIYRQTYYKIVADDNKEYCTAFKSLREIKDYANAMNVDSFTHKDKIIVLEGNSISVYTLKEEVKR